MFIIYIIKFLPTNLPLSAHSTMLDQNWHFRSYKHRLKTCEPGVELLGQAFLAPGLTNLPSMPGAD